MSHDYRKHKAGQRCDDDGHDDGAAATGCLVCVCVCLCVCVSGWVKWEIVHSRGWRSDGHVFELKMKNWNRHFKGDKDKENMKESEKAENTRGRCFEKNKK